jgi:hypothetical protein
MISEQGCLQAGAPHHTPGLVELKNGRRMARLFPPGSIYPRETTARFPRVTSIRPAPFRVAKER